MPLLEDLSDEGCHISRPAISSVHGEDDERSLLKVEVDNDNAHCSDSADCGGTSTDVDTEVKVIGCGFFHHRMVIILGLGNAADAVEILAMNYILADYGTITPWESSFLTAAVFAGMLVGGLAGGVMADAYGRRPIVLLNLGINAASALMSALSPSLPWLILFRTFAGIGVGGIISCLFALCVEHLPVSARARYITILCSFWMLGSIVTAAAAWLMLGKSLVTHSRILPWTNWRHFAAFAGVPALLCGVLTYFYVPESARFLVSQRKFAAAASVLTHIAHINGRREYTKPMLSVQDKKADNRRDNVRFHCMNWFVVSPMLRKVSLCLCVTSFALSFGSYGISTWITKLFVSIGLSNPYANAFLYAGANLPGNLVSYLVVDSWGPPGLLKVALVGAAAAALLFSLQPLESDNVESASSRPPSAENTSRATIVVLACLFNAFTTASWNAFGVVSTNAFPLPVRVTAMSVVNSVGKVGAITAQFVNGFLLGPPPHLMTLLVVTATVLMSGAAAVSGVPSPGLKASSRLTSLQDHRPLDAQESSPQVVDHHAPTKSTSSRPVVGHAIVQNE
ncbi:hypothetical protein, variant 1 [Aphanomyces invadans]|uniref:Major facilitator superfamily (MFS) profile domain-containing protein n=1 Tax=Aphanomyces invadans TaxID=157072 RepID=A0A024UMP1_9STRA|nr:hypothetical protein, variant 1 [Aphanomyces invadans]ETW07132.1 hypothetical protein, variant 1 [Aphanomyces invadans]|eukprot:XP_008863225.1 hypothetical protein, variant 1 [Aphanomyces invadans]